MMDRALSDYVSGKCGIRLGKLAARKTKESSASLYEDDVAKEEIKGLNTDTLTPVMAELYTADLRRAIEPYYDRIAETVMCVVNDCPPALAQALHERGLSVCGGGAKIPGLKDFLAKKTSLPVTICADPEYVTALGGGKLIADPDLLEEIIAQ
jgi:rod shape-determining protein MreB